VAPLIHLVIADGLEDGAVAVEGPQETVIGEAAVRSHEGCCVATGMAVVGEDVDGGCGSETGK
jgi:hypothetical protein